MILETIPPLMDSLQIVWMLSCHYNTNECMVPLMERIAWQLCERVAQAIDVPKIFKYVSLDGQEQDSCCENSRFEVWLNLQCAVPLAEVKKWP